MRVLIEIEYFGKNYAGWQVQKNAETVQNVLNENLTKLLKQEIKVCGSGRTDSGVHAIGQKAHFDYIGNFSIPKIPLAVNSTLPNDIRVKSAKVVDDDFHARFSAKKKTYIYKLYCSNISSPIRENTHTQVRADISKIDMEAMENAMKSLVGTHDFLGFSSTGSQVESTIRTIYSASIKKVGDELIFSITGNGFLYNMVRIIVGTVVTIGLKKLPPNAVSEVIINKNRNLAGKTYPAVGLYLASVDYD